MVEKAKLNKLIVLSDVMRQEEEEILLGWALPTENLDEFLKEVDRVARSCGAVPFEVIDFNEYDKVTTSAINRAWLDNGEKLLEEAESLINQSLGEE